MKRVILNFFRWIGLTLMLLLGLELDVATSVFGKTKEAA